MIRVAAVGDLAAVSRLVQPDAEIGERQRAMWERMLATPDLTVYVACVDDDDDEDDAGTVVGTVMLLVQPNLGYDCRPSAFVEAMVVDEERRRQGVGRALVERLLDDAAAAGCHKVQLLTHKRHATDGAHDFYRSLGFAPEAEGFRRYLGE